MNIVSMMPKLKEELRAIFNDYGLKYVFDTNSQEIKVMKEKKPGEIFLIPFHSIADTLQRMIFYKAAIESNSESALVFEEPEVVPLLPKFMTEEEMQSLIKAMDGENGDLLLFAADKNKIVWNVLGALRVELADQLGLLDKNEFRFLWVTEFPQFEWSDEENRFVAMHHPFTMPMDEDLDMLETNPGAVRAKAYDIVLNGTEIGGGSVRIHQADVQQRMFNALGFTNEAAYEKFGFLLDAFKYGVPPHAGLAYGLDRLVMIMAKRDSIRDVIAFPKVKDASCLLTNAPDVVDEKQLRELSINIDVEEDDK